MKKFLLLFALTLKLSAQTPVLIAHGPATSTINTTGASLIVIFEDNGSCITPTDSQTNIYTLVATANQGGGFASTCLYAAFQPTNSATMTFSVTQVGAVLVYTGIASGPDQVSIGTPNVLPQLTGTITPTNPNELIVSGAAAFGPSVACSVTGLTNRDAAHLTNWNVYSSDSIQTTALAIQGSWNNCSTSLIASFYSIANPGPLSVTNTDPLRELVAGVGGTIPLTAQGGVQPYLWTLGAGTLPTGCTIGGQNLTCTSAVAAGITTGLHFRVTDATAFNAVSGALTLPIVGSAISLSPSGCAATGTQYIAYPGGCLLGASGGAGGNVFSYTQGSGPRDTSPYAAIPPGLALDPSDGTIVGTNYGQGYYGTQYSVTDGYGATATAVVVLQLKGDNDWMKDVFPADSIFHLKVTTLPLAPASLSDISTFTGAHMGVLFGQGPLNTGLPNGIPIVHVPSTQANVTVTTIGGLHTFTSGPIPPYMPIEGTQNNSNPNCCYPGDGHGSVTILDVSGNPKGTYELWQSEFSGGIWFDVSNSSWVNVQSSGPNAYDMLPPGHGATDLAGLPVGPLLLNADEVIGTGTPTTPNGTVRHPTRVTFPQVLAYHVWPAVGSAGAGIGGCTGGYVDPTTNNLLSQGPTAITPSATPPTSCNPLPIPGMTYRLKASVTNPACASTSPQSAVILQGFRDYGIIPADVGNGFYAVGTPDSRWVDSDLACLTNLTADNFEAVNTQSVAVLWPGDDSAHGFLGSTQTAAGTPTAATPTFSPVGGTYSSTQSVTIASTTGGATLCYTTDGSTPLAATPGTCSHGTTYSGPVSVSSSETLNAIATETSFLNSSVGTAVYTITTLVATPTFSPGAGSYSSTQTVTISTVTGGASLIYTTDGSTPTVTSLTCTITHGTLYSGPLTVSTSQTLKAIGCLSGSIASSVGTAAYVISTVAATPTFSPVAGTYTGTQAVTLSTASGGCSGSIVWNTTNAQSGGNLTGATTGTSVSVAASETVYAQVQGCGGFTNSGIGSAAYVIVAPIVSVGTIQGDAALSGTWDIQ